MRRFQKVFVRDTSSAILETRGEARSVFGRISRTLVMVSEVKASKGSLTCVELELHVWEEVGDSRQ
jgi:hypothetical protein